MVQSYQDSVEEGVKYMAADAKDHEKYVVDQLPVLKYLQQRLVKRSHVPDDGDKMYSFEDDNCHPKEGERDFWTK